MVSLSRKSSDEELEDVGEKQANECRRGAARDETGPAFRTPERHQRLSMLRRDIEKKRWRLEATKALLRQRRHGSGNQASERRVVWENRHVGIFVGLHFSHKNTDGWARASLALETISSRRPRF